MIGLTIIAVMKTMVETMTMAYCTISFFWVAASSGESCGWPGNDLATFFSAGAFDGKTSSIHCST